MITRPSYPLIELASQSLRRKEILKKMGVRFRVIPSHYQEKMIKGMSPRKLVLQHALGKACHAKTNKTSRYVMGADTLVACGKKILGKPANYRKAFEMIKMLSGRVHFVYTGVALRDLKLNRIYSGVMKTQVYFKKLSAPQIEHYLEQVQPLDKAGAYAIQTEPRVVSRIKGSYSNVVGLPVELVKKLLNKIK